MRPRLLDLFACEGGATAGYQRAGFHVTAVDLDGRRLARNPAESTVQADALAYLDAHGHEYDAIHASPPCQDLSVSKSIRGGTEHGTAWLLDATLARLAALGRPWAVENVAGAARAMPGASLFCGYSFGLLECRHRLFLSSELLLTPGCAAPAVHPLSRREREIFGRHGNIARVRQEWDVPWMTRDGSSQAIPPVFAEHVGWSLAAACGVSA